MKLADRHHGERRRQKVEKNGRSSRSRGTAGRRPHGAGQRDQWRLEALAEFAHETGGLKWSRSLFLLLLEELYIGDEFEQFIGKPEKSPPNRYPQAVAFAIALRHSWWPQDLDAIVAQLQVRRGVWQTARSTGSRSETPPGTQLRSCTSRSQVPGARPDREAC